MKLKNKQTGEIIDGGDYLNVYDDLDHQGKSWHYNSLAELNDDWEDYVPAEPLIKDEKIRKAVRAWFDANNFGCRTLQYYKDDYGRSHFVHAKGNTMKIFFRGEISNLKDDYFYDIDELCGEEE